MPSVQEQIAQIKDEMSRTQKNKGTKHQCHSFVPVARPGWPATSELALAWLRSNRRTPCAPPPPRQPLHLSPANVLSQHVRNPPL